MLDLINIADQQDKKSYYKMQFYELLLVIYYLLPTPRPPNTITSVFM